MAAIIGLGGTFMAAKNGPGPFLAAVNGPPTSLGWDHIRCDKPTRFFPQFKI